MKIESKKENGTLTISMEGEVNSQTAGDFEKAYSDNAEGITRVNVDLEKVSHITSAGLRVILTMQQDMDAAGGILKIMRPNQAIREVFRLSGFNTFLKIE